MSAGGDCGGLGVDAVIGSVSQRARVHIVHAGGRTLRAVPVGIEPPELARLIDFAERPRTHDWSLRSALVRYAQPQPERVNGILDLVRRIEWALGQHGKLIEREGEDLWKALENAGRATERNAHVLGLLRAAVELDRLGDVLAAWAVDRAGDRPDAEVDGVTEDVSRRLDALGVPRDERRGS